MNDKKYGGSMEGTKLTKKQLTDTIATIYIDPEEVALALMIMNQDGDNVAYFGINGRYLFSKFDPKEGGLH